MAVLAMVRVKNLTEHNVVEQFPFYGRIELAAGETKRVPVDVAQNWADAERHSGKVLVEILDPIELDSGDISNAVSATSGITKRGK